MMAFFILATRGIVTECISESQQTANNCNCIIIIDGIHGL